MLEDIGVVGSYRTYPRGTIVSGDRWVSNEARPVPRILSSVGDDPGVK